MSLCTVALESYVNLPDVADWDGWEVESLIVPCGVLLFRIIPQVADPDCEVVAGNSNSNSRLLRWESLRENAFCTNLTAKTRQPAVQSLIWNIYNL